MLIKRDLGIFVYMGLFKVIFDYTTVSRWSTIPIVVIQSYESDVKVALLSYFR